MDKNDAASVRPVGGCGPPWMSEEEYLFSLRDIPDEILDAAPEEIPEQLWLAKVTAEAALMPDPFADAPGVVLARSLADGIDNECRDGSLIDRITGYERQACWAAAGQAQAIAELAQRRVAAGGREELACYVDEIALALTCSRQAAWIKVHTALDLVDRLPATLSFLATGRNCPVRARIIAEGTRALTDTDARLVQDQVLSAAEMLTPSKLRAQVAAAVAAVDPRDADEKHEDACNTRAVKKYPREHGMTGIWALLPADHAAAVWAAINTHAEASRETGDERSADQRRADSLTDLMTAYLTGTCPTDLPGPGNTAPTDQNPTVPADDTGPAHPDGATVTDPAPDPTDAQPTGPEPEAGGQGCRAAAGHRPPKVPAWCQVQLKVSAEWLLGCSTEPPALTGYGPLPAEVALRLIADAGWQRIVYDPFTGALLDVGSTVHDPPAPLRRHVLIRDGGCTQPICSNPRVDLDHNVPHPQGSTSAANLRSRCRHDHRLKQHPQWTVRVGPDGRIDWVAPTGHSYPEHAPDLRPGRTSRLRPDPDIELGHQPTPIDDAPPPF